MHWKNKKDSDLWCVNDDLHTTWRGHSIDQDWVKTIAFIQLSFVGAFLSQKNLARGAFLKKLFSVGEFDLCVLFD